MRSNKIFYSLNIKDIQTVALDVLDRKLTDKEIEKILDPIAVNIGWYNAIENSIQVHLNKKKRNHRK
jgi:hypothetical protein